MKPLYLPSNSALLVLLGARSVRLRVPHVRTHLPPRLAFGAFCRRITCARRISLRDFDALDSFTPVGKRSAHPRLTARAPSANTARPPPAC